MKKLRINGHIEMFITGKDGKKKKVFDGKNSISTTFHPVLARHLDDNYDIALDNLFSTASPINGQDGIVAVSTNAAGTAFGGIVSLITVLSEPATHQLKGTGTYVNGTGSTVYFMSPIFGKNWIIVVNPSGPNAGSFADFSIALGTSAVQTVPNTETFTVVWTITFTVH